MASPVSFRISRPSRGCTVLPTLESGVENIKEKIIAFDRKRAAGTAPQDEPTVPDGPVAYYATVPLRAMVKAMREAGTSVVGVRTAIKAALGHPHDVTDPTPSRAQI
jgi:hypothetical protein